MEAPPCPLFRLASPRLRPRNGSRAFRIPAIERQPSSMHICRVHSWIDGQRPLNGLRAVRLPSNERLPSSSSQATAFINACSAVNYVAVRSWIAESLSLVSPPHCLLPRDVSRTCCLPTTTTKRLPTSSCRKSKFQSSMIPTTKSKLYKKMNQETRTQYGKKRGDVFRPAEGQDI